GRNFPQRFHQFAPIPARNDDVGHKQFHLVPIALEGLNTSLKAARLEDAIATRLQNFRCSLAQELFIFHDQNSCPRFSSREQAEGEHCFDIWRCLIRLHDDFHATPSAFAFPNSAASLSYSLASILLDL